MFLLNLGYGFHNKAAGFLKHFFDSECVFCFLLFEEVFLFLEKAISCTNIKQS